MAAAVDRHSLTNGFVAVIFAVTGPVAIILTVANTTGLGKDVVDAWIFAAFGIGGLLTVILSLIYRQPLAIAWTMPGSALLISALDHLSFAEAVGAFLVSGLLMVMLGVSGVVGRLMARIPANVAMAMVAGVFLPFGLDLVTGLKATPILSGAMVIGFLLASVVPGIGRYLPPMLVAMVAGAVTAILLGQGPSVPLDADWVTRPALVVPRFTVPAMVELVLPLMISVIAVQNLQGFSVLRDAGYKAPANVLTVVCGYGTLAMGMLGSVPTCVTGPANAILVTSGRLGSHYMGAVIFGALFALVGLFAPLATQAATTMPRTFITVLGGLAMLPVLISAFRTAFAESTGPASSALGPLIAFVVTVSGITLFNIGAPFWGLVFGYAVHLLFDRGARSKGR